MNIDIHRLLDEAFRGVEMTPEAQDLKEEVRANLVARVDELEASGVAPLDAAQRALAELGDVHDLLGDAIRTDGAEPARRLSHEAAFQRHRIRPKSQFVVRAVLWSALAVTGLGLATVVAFGLLPIVIGPTLFFLGAGATGVGLLVGDALSQETTTNHPMPETRAGGFALASFLGVYGLGFGGLVAAGLLPTWMIVFSALGVTASVVLFSFLGATQTNRKKAWVRESFAAMPPNRFEQEPETAARFGIYTAVIWIATFAVIVVLVFTVGWWWAPLAFVVGLAAMMLLLARMLFAAENKS